MAMRPWLSESMVPYGSSGCRGVAMGSGSEGARPIIAHRGGAKISGHPSCSPGYEPLGGAGAGMMPGPSPPSAPITIPSGCDRKKRGDLAVRCVGAPNPEVPLVFPVFWIDLWETLERGLCVWCVEVWKIFPLDAKVTDIRILSIMSDDNVYRSAALRGPQDRADAQDGRDEANGASDPQNPCAAARFARAVRGLYVQQSHLDELFTGRGGDDTMSASESMCISANRSQCGGPHTTIPSRAGHACRLCVFLVVSMGVLLGPRE